jgi:transposase
MESNKLYEELLDLPLISITGVKIESNKIKISCESKLSSAYCPCCLKAQTKINQERKRVIRDLSISDKNVELELTSRQFICEECDRIFYEKFNFVSSYERMTIRYENFIYKRCIGVDLSYVSVQENLEWHRVNRIFKKWSTKSIEKADLLSNIRALGIDEIALKKGHKDFVCVLVNLETGEVVDILEDRTKSNLISYFKALGSDFCERIIVFSSDMCEGYINTAKELFPNADIVVDRFHFFAHLQKALDSCRKALRRQFPNAEELKKVKWLFLKNRVNLSTEQEKQLSELLANSDYVLLKETYEAKESFRAILEENITRNQADEKLTNWTIRILEKDNKYLNKFIKTFGNWYDYILNYFNGRWSNGMVEGINNRIKIACPESSGIKRRAFGFEDFSSFRNRILVEFI